jgi:hypothetical protein
MRPARADLSKKPQSESSSRTRSVVLTVEYLGCLITVRSEVVPGEGVRGSYEIVPTSNRTASAFEDLGMAGLSSDVTEAVDPQYICELAKCAIDFFLEEPF